MTATPAKPTCCAMNTSGNWAMYRCCLPAKYVVGHYAVCGTHKKMLDKFQQQGRMAEMVRYWWHL